jgi:WS/DGAT/MGAT family acyltransferase
MATDPSPPERSLSLLDAAFFLLESDERMSNVGPLMILRPPAGTRSARAFADRLLRELAKRPVAAPFDMVYQPPGLQGLPRLVRAARVDVGEHCRRHTLPAPATDAELFDFVCRLHEQRLDRSRPLWEVHVIDGLARGRVAVYMKIHHGMIDGRGMQAAFDRFFSASPDDRRVRAPWEPRPEGAGRALELPASRAAASRRPAAGMRGSLLTALGQQLLASTGLAEGLPLPFLGTPAVIDTAPSTRRCLAYSRLPLARARAFARAHDAKVNDVLLTVLDMALNAYLGPRGGGALVADMPVALEGAHGGNALAILQFPLGAPAASPLERLAQVTRHTAAVKAHVRQTEPAALVAYTTLVHGIPAVLELLRIPRGPALANAVISNPGGYTDKRYVAGAEMEVGLPVSVLAPGQALNVTIATYDRHLQIAFLGLQASLPDVQRLADLTVRAFDELVAAGTPRRRARPASATKAAKEAKDTKAAASGRAGRSNR